MAIKVTGNVQHNGHLYKKGDVIGDNDITEDQEKALIDAGAATATRGETKGGTKRERGGSKLKQRLSSSSKDRKTVSEKAQERNERKTQQAKAAEVDGDVPPASDEIDTDGNKQPEPNTGAEGGGNDAGGEDTTQGQDSGADGQDNGQGGQGEGDVPASFKAGEDEFTSQVTSNGQTQYRKNGTMISKVDYLEAYQATNKEG